MANQIEREAWVKQDKLKNPIHYVRGTDLLPIVFHFRDFSIPSGATARVFIAKPDGNAVYDSATIEGNDVTVDVTDQMFIELGTALMQISIMDGEEELVSFVQPVDVKQNLKAGDLPASTTDVKFLDEAIEQANEAVNTATAAAQQAATAVQNANQAIEDANDAISDLNAQIASLNTNFASLANNVSISQLDTTAKTLVGAIDELNSKSYLLQGGKQILNNADMNDYVTPGNYFCVSNAVAETLSNCPFTHAFNLKVEFSNGAGLPCQIYREYDTGRIAYRVQPSSSSSSWSQYVYFSDDATVSLYQTMTSTNDVLQSAENQPAYQTKFYWLGGAGYTGSLPSVGSYSYGTAIALKRGSNSIFVVIFSIGKPIYNSYANNSWSGWKDCTGTLISS